MRITVRFHNGARAEALILAGNRNEALVVIEGRRDAEEWGITGGHLYDEAGHAVQIEAMFAVEGLDCADFSAQLCPRTAAAGGRWN